ncbi:MAG: NifB/NifX family molybdenum-iron cluster-binding protein [Candidatus Micrarchaeia archaeon]
MKVLISTSKGGLDDLVCPVFGRCPTFTLVEVDEKEKRIVKTEVMPNPGAMAGGGAGIAAAQAAINSGAKKVITGSCGPNAMAVLMQAGVNVYSCEGKVEDAVKKLLDGKLPGFTAPNVPGHFGMGFGRRFGRRWR